MTIGTGMQFDHRRAQCGGCLNLGRVWIDEQGHANAGITQALDDWAQFGGQPGGVDAALGGDLGPPFGNDTGGVRLDPAGDRRHFGGCGHLEIHRQGDGIAQPRDIVVANMPAVLAQMHGNAVSAGLRRDGGSHQRIGMAAAPGIPQRCDMIDIDPQPQRARGRESGHQHGSNRRAIGRIRGNGSGAAD